MSAHAARRFTRAALSGVVCALPLLAACIGSQAASSKPCFRNTGNARIQFAILHKDAWGDGWTARGWYALEPNMDPTGNCVVVDRQGFASQFYYLAVTQQHFTGNWGYAAFDVADTKWQGNGFDTFGGAFTLKPRSTQDSPQAKSPWGMTPHLGGARLVLCVPERGSKRYASLPADEQDCGDGETRALFGTRLNLPTDGDPLATNTYDVNIPTNAAAPVFHLGVGREPKTADLPPPRDGFGDDIYGPLGMEHALRTALLLYGRGHTLAARWYLAMASGFGDPRADFLLGRIELEKGARDLAYARSKFAAAAEKGHAEAQYELAVLLFTQGDETALDWLKKAAAGGSARAAQRLKALGQ